MIAALFTVPDLAGPRRWKRCCRAVGAALLPLLLAGAAPAAAETLRIQGSDYVGDLPTYILKEEGLLDALDVEISFGRSGAGNLKDLREGKVDFALMAMTPIVFDALADRDPGQPDDPVILSNISHAHPLIYVVTVDGPVGATPASLHGRRLALQKRTNAHFLWSLFAAVHRIDPDQVEIVDLPTTEIPAALTAGRVDAAVLWEPYAAEVRARFGDRLVEFPTTGLDGSRWLLVSRPEVIEAWPERTQAILRAYHAVVTRLIEDRSRIPAKIDELWPDGPEGAAYLNGDLTYQVSLDWSLYANFREELLWAARETGLPPERPLPRFADIVATAPIASALPSVFRLPKLLGRRATGQP